MKIVGGVGVVVVVGETGKGRRGGKTDGRVTVPNTKVSGVITDNRCSLSLTASHPSPLTPMN